MARAAALPSLPGAALRRGALPDQVLAPAGLVQPRRARGNRRGGGAADASARLLDGWRGLGRLRRSALGRRRPRSRTVDPGPTGSRASPRQEAARAARFARPLPAGRSGRERRASPAAASIGRSQAVRPASTRSFAVGRTASLSGGARASRCRSRAPGASPTSWPRSSRGSSVAEPRSRQVSPTATAGVRHTRETGAKVSPTCGVAAS